MEYTEPHSTPIRLATIAAQAGFRRATVIDPSTGNAIAGVDPDRNGGIGPTIWVERTAQAPGFVQPALGASCTS